MLIPENLRSHSQAGKRARWVESLPAVLEEVAGVWSLDVGSPFEPGGQTAWVAPARRSDGSEAVLKLLWPHSEAVHEADALRVWGGRGAVRLFDGWDMGHTQALLMERCVPGFALAKMPEVDQDEILAALLHRLWVAPDAGHPFRPLDSMAREWAGGFRRTVEAGATVDLPTELVERGVTRFVELAAPGDGDVLLATDLHAGNVLKSERDPWLAVDPKPYVGDRTYDAVQHVINCDRMYDDPVALCRRFAGMLDLDSDRLVEWMFARCVVEAPTWPELVPVARLLAAAL